MEGACRYDNDKKLVFRFSCLGNLEVLEFCDFPTLVPLSPGPLYSPATLVPLSPGPLYSPGTLVPLSPGPLYSPGTLVPVSPGPLYSPGTLVLPGPLYFPPPLHEMVGLAGVEVLGGGSGGLLIQQRS